MDIDEVKAAVEDIRASSPDDEAAHAMEDDLHQSVLQFIADASGEHSAIAAEALKTREIDFARWYA